MPARSTTVLRKCRSFPVTTRNWILAILILLTIICILIKVDFIHVNLSRLPRPLSRPPNLKLRLGLISDIHYVDAKDGFNLSNNRSRYYRLGPSRLREAVGHWRSERVDAVLQLGDLLDGSSHRSDHRDADFAEMSRIVDSLTVPWHHSVGNHERYGFGEEELRQWIGRASRFQLDKDNYYFFSPVPGLVIVMLHSYEISEIYKSGGKAGRDFDPRRVDEAHKQLVKNNPNTNVNSHLGLTGLGRRWVAYTGGLGADQLTWLNRTLHKAKREKNKVIIASHAPLHPSALVTPMHLAWDYEKALNVIRGVGKGVVIAALAGHDHEGGFYLSPEVNNVLFYTLNGVVETEPSSAAFAIVDVYPDKLHIRGFGNEPNFVLPFDSF